MHTEPDGNKSTTSTYGQILRSTSLLGLSTGATIIFSIVRVKILAILLGPAGVGLFGLYSLVADLAVSLAGIGAQASGVRQVAEAVGSGDSARITQTATILKWLSIILGLMGGGMLAVLALPVSQLTFGSTLEAGGVALLGIAVFLRLVTGAPSALIQGTRHVGDLARMGVLGAVLNTVVTIPLIYFFGTAGIVPSLIAMAFTSLLAALWYRRRIVTPPASLSRSQVRTETAAMLKLGFAFMASGLLTLGSAYAIRIFILQDQGVEAAGLYQAAWAIGGLYAGFILQAMGTDFYPRLTAIARDHAACNRMVNEQAEISILLAGPGLIATMTLAPLVMAAFYSAEFHPAVTLLRWLCLGMLLRIVAWPIGFIILAKGAQRMFFWTEVAATVVQVGLAWVLLKVVGLNGAGIAFFGLYIWHTILVYFLVHRMTGFQWSEANRRLSLIFVLSGVLIFAVVTYLPFWPATIIGIAATIAGGLYSLMELVKLVPLEWFPAPTRPWIARLVAGRHPRPAE